MWGPEKGGSRSCACGCFFRNENVGEENQSEREAPKLVLFWCVLVGQPVNSSMHVTGHSRLITH